MKINSFLGIAAIILSNLFLHSCLDDDTYENNSYPNALVTVKQSGDKSVFLQLDERTTLLPTNLKTSPFGEKEVRALVNYKEVNEPSKEYSKAVYINWIDSIRTKIMVPDLGSKNDLVYGTDPVEIVKDWVTIAEDGYLTLRFRTKWGNQKEVHFVNLLAGKNPDDPFEIEFRHNAAGDNDGTIKDVLVAFRLDKLLDTKGKTVKLKLKWKSFSGDKSAEFDYTTRKATPTKAVVAHRSEGINVQ